jgi:hypothetical protein
MTIERVLWVVVALLLLILAGQISLTRQMHRNVKHLADIVGMAAHNVRLMRSNADRIDSLCKLWERINEQKRGSSD